MQLEAPVIEDVPARHGAHAAAPPLAKVPAMHGDLMLVPSHQKPAGQGSQLVRVALFPPDVNQPAGHMVQPLAPSPL